MRATLEFQKIEQKQDKDTHLPYTIGRLKVVLEGDSEEVSDMVTIVRGHMAEKKWRER